MEEEEYFVDCLLNVKKIWNKCLYRCLVFILICLGIVILVVLYFVLFFSWLSEVIVLGNKSVES